MSTTVKDHAVGEWSVDELVGGQVGIAVVGAGYCGPKRLWLGSSARDFSRAPLPGVPGSAA